MLPISPLLRGRGGGAGLLSGRAAHIVACAHTPYRTRRCHGVKCAQAQPRLSAGVQPLLLHQLPAFPCFRHRCVGKQHKQTLLLSWAEGKLVGKSR